MPSKPPVHPRDQGLVKMSRLAAMSGVPAPTIKHYIREGLLPPPARRTSANMAWYDPAIVPRIQAIKELQKTRFLPLKMIRELLDGAQTSPNDQATMDAISRVLNEVSPPGQMRRDQILETGVTERDLDWLIAHDFVSPETSKSGETTFENDDLGLLQIIGRIREEGVPEDVLPLSVLLEYRKQLEALARFELRVFRDQIAPQTPAPLPDVAEAILATSEQLVVHLRRTALLPMLAALVQEESESAESP